MEATSIRDGFDPEMGAASNNSGYRLHVLGRSV